jgi:hypothetical protein
MTDSSLHDHHRAEDITDSSLHDHHRAEDMTAMGVKEDLVKTAHFMAFMATTGLRT